MSSQFADAPPSDSELNVCTDGWASVTWDYIRNWAGSRNVLAGRSYQRHGHVEKMVLTDEGRLKATVVGNDRYRVSVWRVAECSGGYSLQSHCTCPVGHKPCKHAVAVIAEYLQTLADGAHAASGDAQRDQVAEPVNGDFGSNRREPAGNGALPAIESPVRPRRPTTGLRSTTSSWDGSLKERLRSKSHEELVEIVCSLLQSFSELRADLRDRLGGIAEPPAN